MTDVLGNIYRSFELEKEAATLHDAVLVQVNERVQRWLQIIKDDPGQTHGGMLDVLDALDHPTNKPYANEFMMNAASSVVYIVIQYGDNEEFRTPIDMRILIDDDTGFKAIEAEVAVRVAEHEAYQEILERKNKMSRRYHRRALLNELAAEFGMQLVEVSQ